VRLADSIDRLIALAARNPRRRVGPARVPFSGRPVGENRSTFERIAGRLRGSEPPTVQGIAMTSVLLRDNRSALYANDGGDALSVALDEIVTALERPGPAT
jgi:hypothetical protein